MIRSKLIVVGAGPGAPDLITYRGIKALQNANVVLYDALVNEELLDFARPDTIKVFVGKRGGQPSFEQEKINQLIVSYAAVYGNVVRLKGGDPFIFGRGLEEIDFAKKNGLEVEVVPGISSSTGLTALNNISLTQRGIADGFWVLTATKRGGVFNHELQIAAQSNSTAVILMGVKQLPKIADAYKAQGRNSTPVMIIQNGSTPEEKVVISDVEHIVEDAILNKVEAPAIIVVGEVVNAKVAIEEQEAVNQLLN